jgi:hypothetical protein
MRHLGKTKLSRSDLRWIIPAVAAVPICIAWPHYGPRLVLVDAILAVTVATVVGSLREKARRKQMDREIALLRNPRNLLWQFNEIGLTLHSKITGQVLHSLVWGSVECITVRPDENDSSLVSFDITAEFDSASIEWSSEGASHFLNASASYLEGFDLMSARSAIESASQSNSSSVIYAHPPDA